MCVGSTGSGKTEQAVDNVEITATVDGSDGIFIGPGDLSVSLSTFGSEETHRLTTPLTVSLTRRVLRTSPSVPSWAALTTLKSGSTEVSTFWPLGMTPRISTPRL